MREFTRYELKSKILGQAPRQGLLVRVYDSAARDRFGLSEITPWPSLGDPNLETILTAIRDGTGESHSIVRRALELARDDLKFRQEYRERPTPLGEALRTPSSLIENHYLVNSTSGMSPGDWLDIRKRGFRAVKIKLSKIDDAGVLAAFQEAALWLGDLKLRLDPNAGLKADELQDFLGRLPTRVRESIDFIEDPFEFDVQKWAAFARENRVPLMLDRESSRYTAEQLLEFHSLGAIAGVIHKPGWDASEKYETLAQNGVRVIVTSLMGHPVGQIAAARVAARLAGGEIHGCFSHTGYDLNRIAIFLKTSGSQILTAFWPTEAIDSLKWESFS